MQRGMEKHLIHSWLLESGNLMVINSGVIHLYLGEWYFSLKVACSDKYFSVQHICTWALEDRLITHGAFLDIECTFDNTTC